MASSIVVRLTSDGIPRVYVHSVFAFMVSAADTSSIRTASEIQRTGGSPKQSSISSLKQGPNLLDGKLGSVYTEDRYRVFYHIR